MPVPPPILLHVSVVLRDGRGRLLLVQEGDEDVYGRWNLPGGHLEHGETLQEGAVREVAEETRLTAELTGLIGIYTGIRPPAFHAIRFVFAAAHAGIAEPGCEDVLAVRWFGREELDALPDEALVSPPVLRRIFADAGSGRLLPLDALYVARRTG